MIPETVLKSEERAAFALRALYERFGYLPYKMNQFEEYGFYLENRDFLVNDRVITFTDTTGRLLALKPDVTLSILKNHTPQKGVKEKLCYNESVYRVSRSAGQFRELLQSGLEAVGDLDLYDFYEVVSLAAESLKAVGGAYQLDLSHLGVPAALLDEAGGDERFRKKALGYFAEKNPHDLLRLCEEAGVAPGAAEKLAAAASLYGPRKTVIAALKPLCTGEKAKAALRELEELDELLSALPETERIRFDLSVVNDMSYYDGIVFKGYLDGVSEGILSGGCYDKLMKKMGKSSRGVGFAVYLDLLEERKCAGRDSDVDVILLYGVDAPVEKVAAEVRAIAAAGKSVSAQREIPRDLRAREVRTLGKEPVC